MPQKEFSTQKPLCPKRQKREHIMFARDKVGEQTVQPYFRQTHKNKEIVECPMHSTVFFCFSVSVDHLTASTSISTKAPLGRSFTATAERAGKGWLKNWA